MSTSQKTDKKRLTKGERMHEIKEKIRLLGRQNINVTDLSETYDVSRHTIYDDIEKIYADWEPEDIHKVQVELSNAYLQAIGKCRSLMITSKKDSDKIAAARTVSQLGREYTEMLERYKLKDKVADKIEHSGGGVHVIIEKYVHEAEEMLDSENEG